MSSYAHGGALRSVSAHDLLVGLGLEAFDHATGTLCVKAVVTDDEVVLNDSTIFEAGQPAGTVSAATLMTIRRGLWRSGTDIATIRAFLGNGAPTNVEVVAALKALIRTSKDIAT